MKTPDKLFGGQGPAETLPEITLENHLTSALLGPDGKSGILNQIDTAPDLKALSALIGLPTVGLRDSQALFLFGHGDALRESLVFTNTVTARLKERFTQLGSPNEELPFATWQVALPFQRVAVHAQAVIPDLAKELAKPLGSMSTSAYFELSGRLDTTHNLFTGRVLAARVRAFLARHKLEKTIDASPKAYTLEANEFTLLPLTEFSDLDLSRVKDQGARTWVEAEFHWLKKECDALIEQRAYIIDGSCPQSINPDTEPETYATYVGAINRFTAFTDRFYKFYLASAQLDFTY
jgi:hypothetical protein